MSRKLVFQQIVDSRFNQDKSDLEKRHLVLMESLSGHESLTVKHGNIMELNFDRNTKQYRIDYRIEKKGRKLTWNDVYEIVNRVNPVPFDFI